MNLYLDDLRDCPEGFQIARNIEEAKHYLNNFEIDILSLDNDLGVDENGNLLPCGYDLVKYICEKNFKINKIYIHTDNPVGRANMYETLLGARNRGFINENIQIFNYPLVPNKYTDKERFDMEGRYTILSKDGKMKGFGYEDEELSCEMEGCNGTQFVVEWEDGDTTIVCGKGLNWIDENTAQLID